MGNQRGVGGFRFTITSPSPLNVKNGFRFNFEVLKHKNSIKPKLESFLIHLGFPAFPA